MSQALITGGSHGIGRELARLYARDGYDLVLVARSEAKLKQTAKSLKRDYGVNIRVRALDLSQTRAAHELDHWCKQNNLQIDVLVNNAGFGELKPFVKTEPITISSMIELNATSLTILARLFLPGMLERNQGGVINIASTAAFFPGPLMAVYYATKAFVLSLSRSISEEVRGTGVVITAVCPGPTPTGFQKRAGMVHSPLLRLQTTTAIEVAKAAYNGWKGGKRVIIPGRLNHLQIWLNRFVPQALVSRVIHRLHQN